MTGDQIQRALTCMAVVAVWITLRPESVDEDKEGGLVSDSGRFVTAYCLVPMCARMHKAGDGPCEIAEYCSGCEGFGCDTCGGSGVARAAAPEGEPC